MKIAWILFWLSLGHVIAALVVPVGSFWILLAAGVYFIAAVYFGTRGVRRHERSEQQRE